MQATGPGSGLQVRKIQPCVEMHPLTRSALIFLPSRFPRYTKFANIKSPPPPTYSAYRLQGIRNPTSRSRKTKVFLFFRYARLTGLTENKSTALYH